MTNQERAEKKKEVELTALQKINTLQARLTTLSAQPVQVYWHDYFAMCRTSSGNWGRVTEIRNSDVHFKIGDKNYSIPLTWLSNHILDELWKAFLRECKEALSADRFAKETEGLI